MKLIDPSGAVVDVPDQQVQAALAHGYKAQAGKSRIVGPDGSKREIGNQHLLQAFHDKYRLETHEESLQKEYGGAGGQFVAGALGVARGASFGLSDVAYTKIGDQTGWFDPGVVKDLADANPTISTVAEFGGAVAGLGKLGFGAKGTGLAGRALSSLAGKTALKSEGALIRALTGTAKLSVKEKALAWGVSGAIDGSLYGAGMGLSEAALGDLDLVSQATAGLVLEGAISGLVTGAAGGAVLGGVFGVGEKAINSLSRRALENMKGKAGEWGAAADEASTFEVLERLGIPRKQAVQKFGSPKEAETFIKMFRDEAILGEKSVFNKGGSIQEWADNIGKAYKEHGPKIAQFHELGDEVMKDLDVAAAFEFLPNKTIMLGQLDELIEKAVYDFADKKSIEWLRNTRNIIEKRGEPLTFLEGHRMQSAIRDNIADINKTKPKRVALAEKAHRIVEDHVHGKLDEVFQTGYGLDKAWTDFNRSRKIYRGIREISGMAKPEVIDQAIQTAERSIAGDIAKSGTKMLVRSLAYRGMKSLPFVAGSTAGEAGITVTSRVFSEARKAAIYSGVQKHIMKTQKRIDSAINAFIKADPATRVIAPALSGQLDLLDPATVKKIARTIHGASANPEQFINAINEETGPLNDIAPDLTKKIAVQGAKVFSTITQATPHLRKNVLQPHRDDFELSPSQTSGFARVLKGALDPISNQEDLGAGAVSPMSIQISNVLYPQLMEILRQQTIEALAESDKPLSPTQRRQLSLFLGIQGDILATAPHLRLTVALDTPPQTAGKAIPKKPNNQKVDDMVQASMTSAQKGQMR